MSAQSERSLLAQVRRMIADSGVYFVADGAARAVSLVLVLAYTRLLGPSDYGILAVTSSVTQLLVPILGMAVVGAVTRFYFEETTEEGRRRLYASTLMFMLVVPTLLLLVVEALGDAGLLDVIRPVPYAPYLRLAVLAAYFSVFVDLPVAVYVARHQARRVAALTIANATLLLGSSLVLVVGLHEGVRGVLYAGVFSSAAIAVVAILLSLRLIGRRIRPSRQLVTAMLLFSLPLVPHTLAQWVLQTSDRVVLTRYVPAVDVGLYYVGYSIGSIATFVVFALDKAMTPTVMAELKANGDSPRVRRLGTYWYGVVVASCLLVAIYGADAIKTFAPHRFHDAARIVPVIALASAVYGVYSIASTGTWFSLRTGAIPLLTAAAAVVNVGLNLLLIPRYGIEAAAWNTVAGFAALGLFQGLLSARRYRIEWEYRRWTILAVVALGAYLSLEAVAPGIGFRRYALSVLALVAVPVVLTVVGFWTREERQWLQRRLPRAISWPGWTK